MRLFGLGVILCAAVLPLAAQDFENIMSGATDEHAPHGGQVRGREGGRLLPQLEDGGDAHEESDPLARRDGERAPGRDDIVDDEYVESDDELWWPRFPTFKAWLEQSVERIANRRRAE